MGRKRSRDNRFDAFDEHDQPTEPMSQIILTPYSSTIYTAGRAKGSTMPLPQPGERIFPQQGSYDFYGHPSYRPSATPVYPFLPPAHYGTRIGSSPFQPRGSPIPIFVGIFFVCVQLLLLMRVALQLTGQPGSIEWVGLIYTISSVFVLPLRLLIDQVNIPVIAGTDLYNYLVVLLTILLYGLFSRILVRFLKALLNSR